MDDRRHLKIRIANGCVHETDCSLLEGLGKPVAKKVSMGGQISTRQFVQLTKEFVLNDDFVGPMWADIVTGTLYDDAGTCGSSKIFFVKGKK